MGHGHKGLQGCAVAQEHDPGPRHQGHSGCSGPQLCRMMLRWLAGTSCWWHRSHFVFFFFFFWCYGETALHRVSLPSRAYLCVLLFQYCPMGCLADWILAGRAQERDKCRAQGR